MPGILRAVADCYLSIYDGLILNWRAEIYEIWDIISYKIDFDRALSAIGREPWHGLISEEFKNYRHYGRLQRLVIADILQVTDGELAQSFRDIPKLKGIAYRRMADFLNGFSCDRRGNCA